MVGSFASNAGHPASGSWLARWLDKQRPHPDTFVCGVRVLAGTEPGEAGRWRYRRSAVDKLRHGEVITLYHGTKRTLRLRVDAQPVRDAGRPRPREGLTVLAGTTADHRAQVLLAVPPGEIARFGVEIV